MAGAPGAAEEEGLAKVGRTFTGMIRLLRGYRPIHADARPGVRGAFERIAWEAPVLVHSEGELAPILASLNTQTFSKNSREAARPVGHALVEQSRADALRFPLLVLFDRSAHASHAVRVERAAGGVLDVHVERTVPPRAGATPVDIGRYTAVELIMPPPPGDDATTGPAYATRSRKRMLVITASSNPAELRALAATDGGGDASEAPETRERSVHVRVLGSLPGAPVDAGRVHDR